MSAVVSGRGPRPRARADLRGVAQSVVTTARRLVRLWRVYAYLDLAFVTHDGRRFFGFLLTDMVVATASVTAMLLLAERFDGIGAWNKHQVAFMLGFGLIVDGLLNTFFAYNVAVISRRIGRGQLDHSLLQPHSLLMTFLTEGFNPITDLGPVLVGAGLVLWAGWGLNLALTPSWLGLLLLQLTASGAIVLAFNFAWGALAFWAPRGAEEISSSTNAIAGEIRAFPLDGIGAAGQGLLLTALPVGFVAWYPSRALLGIDAAPTALAVTPLAALGFLAIAALVFRRGLAHYARTGSSRYLDFGHRR